MGERRGTKALELWCRRITEGYPGVNVQNMTTSWRDGLAFCAMIHHFRPDLVDFNSLDKDDVYGNNELAFRTAEEHLGIPALLDAEDMASCAVPDRLSILTYLSQFYQTFGGLSPSRTALKRTSGESDERLASVSGSPQPKVGVRLGVQRKEPCVVCGLPVFLAEKLVISRSLYHRTCFRCARCNNQLMLGNYYETEDGQYCCETCPDEEKGVISAPVMHQDYNQAAMVPRVGKPLEFHYRPPPSPTYKRALSDEEKSSKRAGVVSAEASKVRLNFMTSHLLAGNENDSPHPAEAETTGKTVPCTPHEPSDEGETRAGAESSPLAPRESLGRLKRDRKDDRIAFSAPDVEEDIQNVNSEDCSLDSKYFLAANQRMIGENRGAGGEGEGGVVVKSTEDHTKDSDTEINIPEEGERLSLVQQRLKIFESSMSNDKLPNSSQRELAVASITKKKKGRDKEIGVETKTETETVMKIEKDNTDNEASVTEEDSSKHSFEEGKIFHVSLPQVSTIDGTSLEITQVDSTPLDEPSEPVENPTKEEEEKGEEKVKKKEHEENKISVEVIPDSEKTQHLGTSVIEAPGIDLSNGGGGDYPEDLNPFQSDEEDEKPKQKKTPSTNPFGSSDEDEETEEHVAAPRPAARSNASSGNKIDAQLPARRRLQAPQINLNPFWSDEEEEEEGGESDGEHEPGKPVPKPRTRRQTPEPSPVPRKTSLDRGGLYASNTSIASTGSHKTPGGTYRKKKPAPPPPLAQDTFSPTSTFDTLVTQSPDDHQLAKAAPLRTPRIRKTKPAPPMPMSTSTPQSLTDVFPIEEKESAAIWDDQKNSKDETNRNRQSLSGIPPELDDSEHRFSATFVDKSAQGKWKRKKGPAPPRPIPHKRKIKVMSVKDVKLELDQIELQQQGLEKQGVRLEQLIRDKSETGQENEEFMSLRVDVEELVLELFALVNEKNELFRRQAELMLLRRQQRLEEEHADVEYQIRCLMSQPEATKTDSDKQREEVLIQRLVEIVERRNEIVECLEMDRRREVEEDRSINEQMGLFAAKSKSDVTASNDNVHSSTISKKEKLKDKVKEKKVKKSHKKDADKDVDETEMKLKRHKKKWF